jgi:hypothetical protein
VGWGPGQGQAFNHGLHPRPRTHLKQKKRNVFLQSSQKKIVSLVKSKLKYSILSVLPFESRHKFFFSMLVCI